MVFPAILLRAYWETSYKGLQNTWEEENTPKFSNTECTGNEQKFSVTEIVG
jgi:hypothetical protein